MGPPRARGCSAQTFGMTILGPSRPMTGTTMTSPASPPALARPASEYAQLLAEVRRVGLLERSPARYAPRFVALGIGTAAGLAGLLWFGDSWWQLTVAAYFGVVFAQVGFLGHDAGHQQVFRSRRCNDRLGLLLSNLGIGLSYGWWMDRDTRHHRNPNEVGRGNLHAGSVRMLIGRRRGQSVFGLYLGATFAPNHKGMPIVDAAARPDFLRRQLFPSMPRRNLRRCRPLAKAFCDAHAVAYAETGVFDSYRRALRYLGSLRPHCGASAAIPTATGGIS